MTRVQDLCRKLRPVMGKKIDGLWAVYLADDADGKADIEQTLELLAAKHLGLNYEPDRSPFPPPAKKFAGAGDIPVGMVAYGPRQLYPFLLQTGRLREHLLIAGRSGSGKTNLTFVLMDGIIEQGVKVLALDWKRGYRDLLSYHPELRVYTIGRDIAPFRFNPLIPPAGCEPHVWIKLIVDVIASAYLGGEGVISLLVAGLDHLFKQTGVFAGTQSHWPTIHELLAWLRTVKLRGRAAMWQASAERILLAMTYGEFGAVVNTQDNSQIQDLLNHNVVLEMDGLSSNSDRTMFSEALTLYLYRYRLAQGPRDQLTNVIILEEAHNLLLAKQPGTKESVLETSIRMIRQYGLGYVFVDQSASLLSKVAFANSYATFALSQKLFADVRAIAAAMNLTDEQRESLSTLPIGSAVVRLADEHPEPFLVRVPRSRIREGSVSDEQIRRQMARYSAKSTTSTGGGVGRTEVSVVSPSDRNIAIMKANITHPPSPRESAMAKSWSSTESKPSPPKIAMTKEEIRFLADMVARPLSTTVSRYQRLHLSRRRGNAVRQQLSGTGIIESIPIATRSGQVILYQLTSHGRTVCKSIGIDPGARPPASLEHAYWVKRTAQYFEAKGYVVSYEHPIPGNGAVDVLAQRPGERIAVEVETGKSDIKANVTKVCDAGFDRVIVVAASAAATSTCQKVIDAAGGNSQQAIELLTWLDVS